MKRTWRVWMAMLAAVVAAGCGGDQSTTEKAPLTVHVGGTMRPVMQRLAEQYRRKTGRAVEVNPAGSGELLAHIEMAKNGDAYVCHDPFMDILFGKFKMGVDGWTVAEVTPVIVVAKGNPKKIKGVADLARPEVELALTDYERSTLGRMLPTIFTKAGVDFDRLNKDKIININKSGGYVANLVVTGNADAAMCWNAVAALRAENLDIVTIVKDLPTPGVDTITSATAKTYTLMPIRVTIATLTCSTDPAGAKGFAEYVASPEAQAAFKEFGFTTTTPRQEYAGGRKTASGEAE